MPRIAGPARGEGVQAVVVALDILELIARRDGGVGVTELSVALGTSKSRIHRHLRTLVEQDYVTQGVQTERYEVGGRLVTLGRLLGRRLDLAGAARGPMRKLRDALGQSVVVSQVERDGVCVLETLPGGAAIEIGVKQGSILGFHDSAQGKAALAFSDETVQRRILAGRLGATTVRTITTPTALARALRTIREQGWATSPGETVMGLNAVAAPILDANGALLGTLAIVGSLQFIEARPSIEQVRSVVEAANQVSSALRRFAS